MEIQDYVNQKKDLYESFLSFLDNDVNENEDFGNLTTIIENQRIKETPEELKLFLHLILKVSKYHYRQLNFFDKIERLLKYLKDSIKRSFSNTDIFYIFKGNKSVLLLLIQNGILIMDQTIVDVMLKKSGLDDSIWQSIKKLFTLQKSTNYHIYFYPEISPFIDEKKREMIKKMMLNLDSNILNDFNEKRRKGENEKRICELIRNDSVEEFITFINQTNTPLSGNIENSIFDTNSLIKGSISIIQYTAFFGSIRIFNYLRTNNVELNPNIWEYAIHGRNAEIIDFLEQNGPKPYNDSYDGCLGRAIKCHHNEIADYIKENLLDNEKESERVDLFFNANINEYAFNYYNYRYFPGDFNHQFFFCYLCKFDYFTLVKLLVETQNIDINQTLIYKYIYLFNELIIIQLPGIVVGNRLSKCKIIKQVTIPSGETSILFEAFGGCSALTQITIPSSVTKIGKRAFYECVSLTNVIISSNVTSIEDEAFISCISLVEITIPSSVTRIGKDAFNKCHSLRCIRIPSGVTVIEERTFYACKSLTQVSLPSALTKIETDAFAGCSSLERISIPSSLVSLGRCAFYDCSSLREITIPSSVSVINKRTFQKCSTLRRVFLPSSLTKIDDESFSECIQLVEIDIPMQTTYIGKNAFYRCKNLISVVMFSLVSFIGQYCFCQCESITSISIPSSLTKIEAHSFKECKKLLHLKIPRSVTVIEKQSFQDCKSITQIEFESPSSLTKIDEWAFYGCQALTQLVIPPSVTEIGKDAFAYCTSLRKVSVPPSAVVDPSAFNGCSSLSNDCILI